MAKKFNHLLTKSPAKAKVSPLMKGDRHTGPSGERAILNYALGKGGSAAKGRSLLKYALKT